MGFTGALGGCNSCRQPAKLGGLLESDSLCQDGVAQSADAREKFILEFDFSQYVASVKLPVDFDRHLLEREICRFMLLSLYGVEFELRAPHLDEVWHAMILDTPRYFEFCRRAFGCYLHHAMTGADPECEPNFIELLTAYELNFGELPPSEIWDIESMTQPTV